MKYNQEKAFAFLNLFAQIGKIIAQSTADKATQRYEQCRTGGYTSLSKDDDAMHHVLEQATTCAEESKELVEEVYGLHTAPMSVPSPR